MKILMILDNEFTGDLRVENEIISLQKEGFQVTVLCFNYGDALRTEDFYGAKIVRIKLSLLLKKKLTALTNTAFDIYSYFWKYQIKKYIRNNEVDIIHAHDLYMAQPVVEAVKHLNIKLVLDLHENYIAAIKYYNWYKKSILVRLLNFFSTTSWEKYESKFINKFDKIIVLSGDFKDTLIRKYRDLSPNKFGIYPNYPNIKRLESYRIEEEVIKKNDSFFLFYFGGVAERRGIYTCLKAQQLLKTELKKIKLLIVGPVDKKDRPKFYSYINDPELRNSVIYKSWMDIKFLPSLILESDICLSPIIKNDQHESGVANKVFQYMLFGKPVIVSNCRPQQNIIETEKCGLVFESENHVDLAEKVLQLYKNDALRKTLGNNGKKAVKEKYNWETASKNLISLYKTIIIN